MDYMLLKPAELKRELRRSFQGKSRETMCSPGLN